MSWENKTGFTGLTGWKNSLFQTQSCNPVNPVYKFLGRSRVTEAASVAFSTVPRHRRGLSCWLRLPLEFRLVTTRTRWENKTGFNWMEEFFIPNSIL
jgi:hypothetical protein